MMSSAPIAFAVQNAFSRASISLRADAPFEHVGVDGAQLGDQLAGPLDILVQSVRGPVLKRHNEIRLAAVADLVGDAQLEVLGMDEARPSSCCRCTRGCRAPARWRGSWAPPP